MLSLTRSAVILEVLGQPIIRSRWGNYIWTHSANREGRREPLEDFFVFYLILLAVARKKKKSPTGQERQ